MLVLPNARLSVCLFDAFELLTLELIAAKKNKIV